MPAPYDYSINVQSPFEAALGGLKLGATIADIRTQQEAAKLQQEAAARAVERQQMLSQGMQALISNPNPTARDFTNIAMLMPEKDAASMRANWDTLNKSQQENELRFSGQVMSAFSSGAPDIGLQLLREKAEAERNSGREDRAKAYETYAQMAERNPKFAEINIGTMLGGIPGGDKVITSAIALGGEKREQELQPFKMTEAQAKAEKAAVDAKFAESNAVADLEQKGWNIKKLQNDIDISRQNVKIAALNADLNRENNLIKRQELQMKLDQAQRDRDSQVRTKVADLESANTNIDNMLNTADRILKTPKDVIGSAAGPISSRVLTVSQDTADFEELLTTLGSQAFLAQIPNIKGMGALSNAEGEKLTGALQNFSLRQSPERLVENVREAQRLLQKARKNIAERSGLPQTPQDRPAAAPPPDGDGAAGIRVTTPSGQVITFPNQQAADAFKRAAGL